jgi:hypothetical protein
MIRPSCPLQVALRDGESGAVTPGGDVLQAIVSDIQSRPTNAEPVDASSARRLQQLLSDFRHSAALVHPETSEVLVDEWAPYTRDELDLVLDTLDHKKKCFRGCYAAVKAPCAEGRALTLSLHNLSAVLHITATVWARRLYNSIRKKKRS